MFIVNRNSFKEFVVSGVDLYIYIWTYMKHDSSAGT